jgi:transcription elongation factor Elf1
LFYFRSKVRVQEFESFRLTTFDGDNSIEQTEEFQVERNSLKRKHEEIANEINRLDDANEINRHDDLTSKKSEKKEKLFGCHLCSYRDRQHWLILRHLAVRHFKSELKEKFFSVSGKLCLVCDQLITDSRDLLYHVVKVHHALDGRIPENFLLQVRETASNDLQDKKSLLSEVKSNPDSVGSSLELKERSFTSDLEELVISNKFQPQKFPVAEIAAAKKRKVSKKCDKVKVEKPVLKSRFKCYKCSFESADFCFVLRHIAARHFKDLIVEKYVSDDKIQCRLCQSKVRSKNHLRDLLYHIVGAHKVIDDLIPSRSSMAIETKSDQEFQDLRKTEQESEMSRFLIDDSSEGSDLGGDPLP